MAREELFKWFGRLDLLHAQFRAAGAAKINQDMKHRAMQLIAEVRGWGATAHLLRTDPNVTYQQWQEAMLAKEKEQQATGVIAAQDLANDLLRRMWAQKRRYQQPQCIKCGGIRVCSQRTVYRNYGGYGNRQESRGTTKRGGRGFSGNRTNMGQRSGISCGNWGGRVSRRITSEALRRA